MSNVSEQKAPPSEVQQPPLSWLRYKGVVALFIGVAVLLAAVIYGVSQLEDKIVRGTCEEIAGGYSCLFSSNAKKAEMLEVCWSLNRVCENGIRSGLHKCQSLFFDPGKPTKSIVATSEFENTDKCDKVSALNLENMTLGLAPRPAAKASSK